MKYAVRNALVFLSGVTEGKNVNLFNLSSKISLTIISKCSSCLCVLSPSAYYKTANEGQVLPEQH